MVGAVLDSTGIDAIPRPAWITAGVIGMALGSFLPFNKVRRERNTLAGKLSNAQHIKDALLRLHSLRQEGVRLREGGFRTAIPQRSVPSWMEHVEDWQATVLAELDASLPVEAGFIRTLDWFSGPKFVGWTDEHRQYMRVLHRDLQVIGEIIQRHETETRP